MFIKMRPILCGWSHATHNSIGSIPNWIFTCNNGLFLNKLYDLGWSCDLNMKKWNSIIKALNKTGFHVREQNVSSPLLEFKVGLCWPYTSLIHCHNGWPVTNRLHVSLCNMLVNSLMFNFWRAYLETQGRVDH